MLFYTLYLDIEFYIKFSVIVTKNSFMIYVRNFFFYKIFLWPDICDLILSKSPNYTN